MPGGRPRVIVLLAVAAGALAGSAVAFAQAPSPPAGNYGGGAVLAPPKSIAGAGNMLISFSVSGGDVRVRASPGARCETAPIKTTVPLTADGTFSAIGVSRATPGGGRRITTTYDISGTIDGNSASGTARGATSVATRGRATRRCTSGNVRWGARRASGELGAAGAVAKARLYGTTSQRLEGPRRAIVLRVSSDATKLTRALYDVTLTCGTRKRTDIYDAPRRNLTIEDDGTFADVERFEYRDRTTIQRDDERFAGQIGAAGANGTFSVVSRVTDRRSGKTISTCRSGRVTWAAST